MQTIEIKKRSQAERVAIAMTMLESVWDEVKAGQGQDILQEMVYVQVFTNRIVHRLNADKFGGRASEGKEQD